MTQALWLVLALSVISELWARTRLKFAWVQQLSRKSFSRNECYLTQWLVLFPLLRSERAAAGPAGLPAHSRSVKRVKWWHTFELCEEKVVLNLPKLSGGNTRLTLVKDCVLISPVTPQEKKKRLRKKLSVKFMIDLNFFSCLVDLFNFSTLLGLEFYWGYVEYSYPCIFLFFGRTIVKCNGLKCKTNIFTD